MNYPSSQPIATFLQQRPPPTAQTDCFFTYTRISSQCKPIDRIADSIDPFELANNPNQKYHLQTSLKTFIIPLTHYMIFKRVSFHH